MVITIEDKFNKLADKWDKDTEHLSSPSQIHTHCSYLEILAIGKDVIPIMLKDLQVNRRHWFSALSYLTGVNPINPLCAGKVNEMIDCWINWGRNNGYSNILKVSQLNQSEENK